MHIRSFFTIISSTLIISCSFNSKIYYFDFDQVEHYSYSEYQEISYLSENDSITLDTVLFEIAQGNGLHSFDDTTIINELESMGYKKNLVPQEKHEELNELFSEKEQDPNDSWAMCMPVFRDILIFKKENRITGIAKICFGCDYLATVGTSANTKYFGSFEGYENLYKLLYSK